MVKQTVSSSPSLDQLGRNDAPADKTSMKTKTEPKKPKVVKDKFMDSEKYSKSFKRIDRSRNKVDQSERTIVVTNPHGTGFMRKAGMDAILVKFQGHQGELDLEPNKLYNMTLTEEGGDDIELLYFTNKPGGKQGEIVLLKWFPDTNSLRPIRTCVGQNLEKGLYSIEEGQSWKVEAIYSIRKRVNGNVIEEIREDINYLERIKRREADKIATGDKAKKAKMVDNAVSGSAKPAVQA